LRGDPSARFPTIAVLADELAQAATGSGAPAARSPRLWIPLLVGIGASVAVVILAVVVLGDSPTAPTAPTAPVAPAPVAITPDVAPVARAPDAAASPDAPPARTPPQAPTARPALAPRADPPSAQTSGSAAAGSAGSSSAAPAPAGLDPMITPSGLVHTTFTDKVGQDAQALRERDDGAGCLRELGSAAAGNTPARSVLRATCEMMIGRCAAGAKRIRDLGFVNKPALDLGLRYIERTYCPSTDGDLTTRIRRFEAQVLFGTRVNYSLDRYAAQLLDLAADARVANVPAEAILGADDGPTVVAKGFIRIVPLLRDRGSCDPAAVLEARATALGVSIPELFGRGRCP
jgi:hypothetical protein